MRLSRTIAALAMIASAVLLSPPSVAEAAGTAQAPRVHVGKGDQVIRITATKDRGFVKVAHTGASNFALWAVNPAGGNSELLVNRNGRYSGVVVFNTYSWHKTAAFRIETDGDWTAQIFPFGSAPLWKTAAARLSGDRVLKLRTPARGVRVMRYRHVGDGHFAVFAYPAKGEPGLLVNRIGKVSGRVVIPAGTKFVSVMGNGKWYLIRR